jgi:choline-sulfatase
MRRGAAWIVVLAAGCVPGGCRGPSRPPAADHAGLILITLDTFRHDHLGCAGNPTVRTPNLDRLERRGVQWPDAVTAIPLTTPSHATILTGLTPRRHGLVKNRMRLDPSVPTLAEQLTRAGWHTGAIVSSRIVLSPEFGLDRGFDSYSVIEPARLPASGEGAHTADAALEWLRAYGGPGSFLWVHFFDAHLPYLAPAPWNELYDPGYRGPMRNAGAGVQAALRKGPPSDPDDVRHLARRYAAEVSFVDACVGRILRDVEREHPDTRVLVVGDHGEGLYEHERYFGHDVLLYETTLRVPFLLAGGPPALRARCPDRLVPDAARTVDVTPTLLGLAGLHADPDLDGLDLTTAPPRSGDDLRFVVETHPSEEKAPARYALRTGREKVIREEGTGRREAYDLEHDPGERADLAARQLPWCRALQDDLALDLEQRPPTAAVTVDEEHGGPDPATRDALESLGYIRR